MLQRNEETGDAVWNSGRLSGYRCVHRARCLCTGKRFVDGSGEDEAQKDSRVGSEIGRAREESSGGAARNLNDSTSTFDFRPSEGFETRFECRRDFSNPPFFP